MEASKAAQKEERLLDEIESLKSDANGDVVVRPDGNQDEVVDVKEAWVKVSKDIDSVFYDRDDEYSVNMVLMFGFPAALAAFFWFGPGGCSMDFLLTVTFATRSCGPVDRRSGAQGSFDKVLCGIHFV